MSCHLCIQNEQDFILTTKSTKQYFCYKKGGEHLKNLEITRKVKLYFELQNYTANLLCNTY